MECPGCFQNACFPFADFMTAVYSTNCSVKVLQSTSDGMLLHPPIVLKKGSSIPLLRLVRRKVLVFLPCRVVGIHSRRSTATRIHPGEPFFFETANFRQTLRVNRLNSGWRQHGCWAKLSHTQIEQILTWFEQPLCLYTLLTWLSPKRTAIRIGSRLSVSWIVGAKETKSFQNFTLQIRGQIN